jgi:hypothetical protein
MCFLITKVKNKGEEWVQLHYFGFDFIRLALLVDRSLIILSVPRSFYKLELRWIKKIIFILLSKKHSNGQLIYLLLYGGNKLKSANNDSTNNHTSWKKNK